MIRRILTLLLLTAVAVAATLVVGGPAQAYPRGACDSTLFPEGKPGDTFDTISAIVPSVRVHEMNACQWLNSGASWKMFHGTATLKLTNGDLAIYNSKGTRKWHTNTAGSGATQMLWQQDGNLVLYTSGYARAVWASGTNGDCPSSKFPYLATQSDNNLVIYCGVDTRTAMWSSGTSGI